MPWLPSIRADLRAARVVFAARAAAAARPRHALSFDALAGALSEAALAAMEDAAPELLAACVLAAVGVDAEWVLWETHIISLNQNIKDAVAAHKRHRKFVDVMEGSGAAPVSVLADEPPVVVAGAPEDVSVDVGGEVVADKALYVEQEL